MELIKIINEKEKLVISAKTEDAVFIDELKKEGFVEGESSEAWDGRLYVKGYAPEKPEERVKKERIEELKIFLYSTDYQVIREIETGEKEDDEVKKQRAAAREEIKRLEK